MPEQSKLLATKWYFHTSSSCRVYTEWMSCRTLQRLTCKRSCPMLPLWWWQWQERRRTVGLWMMPSSRLWWTRVSWVWTWTTREKRLQTQSAAYFAFHDPSMTDIGICRESHELYCTESVGYHWHRSSSQDDGSCGWVD
jgi:hypothetical protein